MSEDTNLPASEPTSDAAAPSATATPRPAADLSREIEHTVQREPGDQVRCTKVGGDTYRCNWWSVSSPGTYDNPAMKGGQLATDHRIRKSSFLRVTKSRRGLQIVDAAAPIAPR